MPLTKDGYLYSGYESKSTINPENVTEEKKQLMKHLAKKVALLQRENQRNLLTEFIDYLNERYFEVATNPVMMQQIESFLEEREIKWEQKIGKVSIDHKEDE